MSRNPESTRMRVARRFFSFFWLTLVVTMFCLPLFAGLGRSDLQNDEAIYSYAVDSILETGDWLNPRSSPNSDAVFIEKPPLKFWMVALPMRLGLLPHNEFGLRFWDALFGSLAFLYVFAIGRRMAGPFCGFVAVLVLFSFHPLIFDHGLRTNNMEAPLMLAYCGGVYHYLRWAELEGTRERRRHALAVGICFFLGFMTKFVAAAFLPVILGAASLVVAPARARLRREWRTWAAVAAVVFALIAPWFVYQMTRPGPSIWYVMFGEHVFVRFSSSLDPRHVQPWTYYFTYLFGLTDGVRTFWPAVAGGLLTLARVLRTRWMDGAVTLIWFALPLTLMSLGTSKLGHYAYPYLPPIALAVGYLLAWGLRVGCAVADGRLPDSMTRLGRTGTMGRMQAWMRHTGRTMRVRIRAIVAGRTAVRRVLLALRIALLALAAVWLLLAIIALAHPGRLEIAGIMVARHPSVGSLAVNALAAAAIAGHGAVTARIALPVILLTLAPLPAYRASLPQLMVERHPMRSARDCIMDVRERERNAGRPVRDMFVCLPPGSFLHSHFYYFRDAGWDEHTQISAEEFSAMIDAAGSPRLVLLSRSEYERLWWTDAHAGQPAVPRVPLNGALLLVPGPFSACATE